MQTSSSLLRTLPDGWSHPVVGLAQHDHLSDLESRKVGETELDELSLLVQLIQLLQRLLERERTVCSMQVEDIDTVRAEFGKGLVQHLLYRLRLVSLRVVRVPFRGHAEATLLPLGIASEGLLLAADVDAGGVNFRVALLLELVEDGIVRVEGGDAGTGCGVRAAMVYALER